MRPRPSTTDAAEHAFLMEVLLGDEDAVALIEALGRVSQVWDDLLDNDVAVDDRTLNLAFYTATVTVPANPFYRRWATDLTPAVSSAIMDWIASNELAKGDDEDKAIGHVIRDNLCSVILVCAHIVGGYDHATKVGASIHRFGRNELSTGES